MGSTLGAGFGVWAANSLSEASSLGMYAAQQFSTAKIGSASLEMPVSIIGTGLTNKKN